MAQAKQERAQQKRKGAGITRRSKARKPVVGSEPVAPSGAAGAREHMKRNPLGALSRKVRAKKKKG